MNKNNLKEQKIAVIGLGYVGLPLALRLASLYPVAGFDIDHQRIEELRSGFDRTREISRAELRSVPLHIIDNKDDLAGYDIYIVTVPTPVNDLHKPDLGALMSACKTVGSIMEKGAIVVFESTVYPGVTEDRCGPELEKVSGLNCGEDFMLGYSPERINPGDTVHTVDKITKIVAGQTPEVTEILAEMYGRMTEGGVFIAKNIRTAEAAKVIENAQRDVNIAFINEVTMIFNRMGLSSYDVLEAARTKWNFLDFRPGLVGGHCIGVDPLYLAHAAGELGHNAEVILTGRKTNDAMAKFIAEKIHNRLNGPSEILMLGLTFKENVPDLRNSKVVDLIHALKELGHQIDVHDAMASRAEAQTVMGIDLIEGFDRLEEYDCVVGAVAHSVYTQFNDRIFRELLKPDGLIADLKGMWRDYEDNNQFQRWSL